MNILPSYNCNLSCPFCMNHKLDNGDLLDLDWLEDNIKTVPPGQIDILGGEPSLLDDSYMKRLIKICKEHAGKNKVGMYTNLIKVSPYVNDVELTVSYDPGSRQLSEIVRRNMLLLDTPFEINMIVTKHVVERGAKWLIGLIKRMRLLKKITLSTLTVFPGCIDLRPAPSDLADFCRDIVNLDEDRKVYFYPIATWKKDFVKAYDPAQLVEILPSQKFRIAIRDFYGAKEFNTFAQAAKYYCHNYMSGESCCQGCSYFRRCPHMYTDGVSCHGDRLVTEAILSALAERKQV